MIWPSVIHESPNLVNRRNQYCDILRVVQELEGQTPPFDKSLRIKTLCDFVIIYPVA